MSVQLHKQKASGKNPICWNRAFKSLTQDDVVFGEGGDI